MVKQAQQALKQCTGAVAVKPEATAKRHLKAAKTLPRQDAAQRTGASLIPYTTMQQVASLMTDCSHDDTLQWQVNNVAQMEFKATRGERHACLL